MSVTAKIAKWGGVSAVLNGVVWFILTPLMATIWRYEGIGAPTWQAQPLLVKTIGRWWAERGAFTFAPAEVVYFSYGRTFFLVYLLIIPGLMALHGRQARAGTAILSVHQRRYTILLVSLLAADLMPFMLFDPLLVGYWPNGPMFPVSLTWALIGMYLWVKRR
jgi:hypothetical protein